MTDQPESLVVWMASVSWDGIRGTDRHMAMAMARHAHILWVDPPVSPATSSRRGNGGARAFRPRLSMPDPRITRLTPVALPGFTRPGVRSTTARLVRRQVARTLRRLGIRPYATVATHLDDVLGHWGPGVVDVLYGTDDYVAGAELLGISVRRLRRHERRAVKRADVVAAVTPELARRWADLGATPSVIPNGCSPVSAAEQEIPLEVRQLPHPVVGLVGQLSARIDLDVLRAVAEAGYSLLLVGPVDPQWEKQGFRELAARANVHYAGPVPAEAVPSYLAVTDVGITPYRDSSFNRASFPLKTLEYLRAGVPVVSADLPAAQWLRGDLVQLVDGAQADQVLALAGSPAEYLSALGKMGRDPARAQQCIEFAGRHTWDSRADQLAAAIGLP